MGDDGLRLAQVAQHAPDLDASVAFYEAVGYELIGEVPETGIGHLTMLKLPGDEFVTIELVHDPGAEGIGTGRRLSHLVIQVDAMDDAVRALAARGIEAGPPSSPDGSQMPRFPTCIIEDEAVP